MKKSHLIIFTLFLALILSTACRTEKIKATPPAFPTETPAPQIVETHPPTPTPTIEIAPTETPVPIDTPAPHLSLDIVGHVDSLNPLLDLNPVLKEISPLIFPSLNQLEWGTSLPQPYAAELPAIAADNLTLTYTLRLTNITAADVKASIETAIQPELDDIRNIEILDENSVRISLTEPNCALIDALGQLPIVPQNQITADAPAGLSPYAIESWDADSQILELITTQKNAPATQITVQFFSDVTSPRKPLDSNLVDKIIAPPSLYFIAFNNQRPPFDDVKLRHALSRAIDRAQLLGENLSPAASIFPQWDGEIPAFDADAARTELDTLGITDRDGDGWRELPDEDSAWEVAVAVDVNREDLQAVAFWVAQYYRDAGIKARVELLPFSTLIDDLLTHDYQTAVYDWRVVETSNLRMRWSTDGIDAELGQNIAGYSNPDVDAWIDALDRVPHCDVTGRAEIMQSINEQLLADRPFDFLGFSFKNFGE